jgi:hypothetical protein
MRRMLLAVDASGRVVLMAASSGHMMMVQHVAAGPPLAVNINSESLWGRKCSTRSDRRGKAQEGSSSSVLLCPSPSQTEQSGSCVSITGGTS